MTNLFPFTGNIHHSIKDEFDKLKKINCWGNMMEKLKREENKASRLVHTVHGPLSVEPGFGSAPPGGQSEQGHVANGDNTSTVPRDFRVGENSFFLRLEKAGSLMPTFGHFLSCQSIEGTSLAGVDSCLLTR